MDGFTEVRPGLVARAPSPDGWDVPVVPGCPVFPTLMDRSRSWKSSYHRAAVRVPVREAEDRIALVRALVLGVRSEYDKLSYTS